MDRGEAQKALIDALNDAELMSDDIFGPTFRQIKRLMDVQLRGERLELSFAGVFNGSLCTTAEAAEICEEGKSMSLEAAGAYSALSRLLPEFVVRFGKDE